MHLSSQRDNYFVFIRTLPRNRKCVFSLLRTSGPRRVAPAVTAENAPPEHFLNAATDSQRDNLSRMGFYQTPLLMQGSFSCLFAKIML